MSTLQTLQDLLIQDHQLTPEQVGPEALLVDLGIDSLALVELMFQVEDRFGIEVPLDNPGDLRTLGDVERYVDGLVARGATRTRKGGGAGSRGPSRPPAGVP